MNPNEITFLILAFLAVVGGLGVVVFGDRPVWSALSLVFNFLILAVIYFTLGAQFLGITQVMVYAGAIMVLFLFVIMILRLAGSDSSGPKQKPAVTALAAAAGAATFVLIGGAILNLTGEFTDRFALGGNVWGTPEAIGWTLFSGYVWPFELASILLLVGVVGAILLAKRRFD